VSKELKDAIAQFIVNAELGWGKSMELENMMLHAYYEGLYNSKHYEEDEDGTD
jgi:hypothetical protein